jgi:4-hydroxy-tetrahydrodipicolinate reductase
MIRIILNGCGGKMGRAISGIAKTSSELEIVAGVDKYATGSEFGYPVFSSISDCDVAVDVILDFSRPEALEDLLSYALDKNVPLVLCTTGYSSEQLKQIDKAAESLPLFRSANMSIGVNVVNSILKKISALLFENYDIEIIEKHHNQKVDSPSGTALLLANTIKNSIPEETEFVYGREGLSKRSDKEIGIHAVRGGSIVGDHEVIFAGQGEIIEIKHTALSRDVFAVGSLKACQFMYGKASGLYSMDDVVRS